MNSNIPDLGDFGYVPTPSAVKGVSWQSILIVAIIGVVVIFIVRKFLQSLINEKETNTQIIDAIKNIDQAH